MLTWFDDNFLSAYRTEPAKPAVRREARYLRKQRT
jgi:hypothetical protein